MVNFNLDSFINKYVTGREKSLIDEDLNNNIQKLREKVYNRSLLVIGGAGTIGSWFIKSILKFSPSKLYVVDLCESRLAELTRDLRSSYNLVVPPVYKTYAVDFGSDLFHTILDKEGPFDIVANFAAHKHVRNEKDIYAIRAMFETNVFKNEKLLHKLAENPPEHFFCVSTDKANSPGCVMGASKRIMEEVLMAYSLVIPIKAVRFPNIAFSNGSLLQGFICRIANRQPLPVPLDVKRYFISPLEAGQICMLSAILGEPGDIFFTKLSLDKLKRLPDIARDFLTEHGYTPRLFEDEDEAKQFAGELEKHEPEYPVYIFRTFTSGEKLVEEFHSVYDKVDKNKYVSLGVIKNTLHKSFDEVNSMLESLRELLYDDITSKHDVVDYLQENIPNFSHIETGENLDQHM